MTSTLVKRTLPARLREIAELDRTQCRQAWSDAFGAEPPKYLSIPFMQKVLSQDLQCKALGGYSVATRRALKRVVTDGEADAVLHVTEGATLVREWNGRVYRVEVLDGVYLLDGKTYRSLSSVARHITGARWSGPRFFGLNGSRNS